MKKNLFAQDLWSEFRVSIILGIVFLLVILACFSFVPGCQRIGSSMWAGAAGANWIVVQYNYNGTPFNCWKLENVSVSNESQSDGIYWEDSNGHLVHVSGWYDRVQVSGGRFEEGAKLLGVDLGRIQNGKYIP